MSSRNAELLRDLYFRPKSRLEMVHILEEYEVSDSLPVGGFDNNASMIEQMTDPYKALYERITNGVDSAIVHTQQHQGFAETVKKPKDAISVLSKDSNWWVYLTVERDVKKDAKREKFRVTVVDRGTGIRPANMTSTILSLSGSNKIDNPLVIGTFGVGGSSSYNFAEFTLLICRAEDDPETLGFTVVYSQAYGKKLQWLFAVDDDGLPFRVTVSELEQAGVKLWQDLHKIQTGNQKDAVEQHMLLPNHGVLVRMVGYDMRGRHEDMWYFLRKQGFGMDMPIRYIPSWSTHPYSTTGLRYALDEHAELLCKTPSIRLKLRDDMGEITLRAWVLDTLKAEKPKKKTKDSATQIGRVTKEQSPAPIFITYNNLTHDRMPSGILLRNAGLNYLQANTIFEVVMDDLTIPQCSQCFSSTREHIKDDYLDAIKSALSTWLTSDGACDLREAHQKLMNDSLTGSQSLDSVEINARMQAFLKNPIAGAIFANFGGGSHTDKVQANGLSIVKQYGDAGAKQIKLYPSPIPTEVHARGATVASGIGPDRYVAFSTDADDSFAKYFSIRFAKKCISQTGRRELQECRGGFYVLCKPGMPIGEVIDFTITLVVPPKVHEKVPAGLRLESAAQIRVIGTEPAKIWIERTQRSIPKINVREVKGLNDDKWSQMVASGMDAAEVALRYEYRRDAGEIDVFWNSEFAPFRNMMMRAIGRKLRSDVRNRIRKDYETGMIFMAMSSADSGVELDEAMQHRTAAVYARANCATIVDNLDRMTTEQAEQANFADEDEAA